MKIDSDVLIVLNNGKIDGKLFYLPPGQLDRNLYIKVNKVLESLQGKWQKKLKAHQFEDNFEEKLINIINNGEYSDKKKENNFFETPSKIVKQMIELAKLNKNDRVLETSAGTGNIVDEIVKITKNICLFEIDSANCECLKKKGYEVNKADFLISNFTDKYNNFDKCIQNPPFNIRGTYPQCDIDFCLHAWKFLKPGGILVSIVSESPFFRENSASREFRNWILENNGKTIKLPEKSFASSGTNVNTRILKIKKQ